MRAFKVSDGRGEGVARTLEDRSQLSLFLTFTQAVVGELPLRAAPAGRRALARHLSWSLKAGRVAQIAEDGVDGFVGKRSTLPVVLHDCRAESEVERVTRWWQEEERARLTPTLEESQREGELASS